MRRPVADRLSLMRAQGGAPLARWGETPGARGLCTLPNAHSPPETPRRCHTPQTRSTLADLTIPMRCPLVAPPSQAEPRTPPHLPPSKSARALSRVVGGLSVRCPRSPRPCLPKASHKQTVRKPGTPLEDALPVDHAERRFRSVRPHKPWLACTWPNGSGGSGARPSPVLPPPHAHDWIVSAIDRALSWREAS